MLNRNNCSVGNRVIWNNDSNDQGTIISKTDYSVTIEWDNDGQIGTIDYRDTQKVSKLEE